MLINSILASLLVTGSVSWLHYSDRLVEFPLGIFGVALGIVIVPALSRIHVQNDPQQFSQMLDWALRWAVAMVLPSVIALFILAQPILTTLFEYGAFSAHDTAMSAKSLRVYSFGLIGFVLIKILAPGFFARQDTKTPVQIALKAMLLNILIAPVMAYYWAHVGLAGATAISAILNGSLLFLTLRKQGVFQLEAGWIGYLARVLLACGLMAATLLLTVPVDDVWHEWQFWERGLAVLGVVLLGSFSYIAALFLLGIHPKTLFKAPLK